MKHIQLIVFLTLAILGALITPHYGESWDELQFYKYADHAIESYSTWFKDGQIIGTGNTYDNYGPAFVIFTSVIARWLHNINPDWLVSDLRHFIYFLTFLGGVWAFYNIVKRWVTQIAATTSTLLFLTQPLFWGHSFISPKDIPFMSLFLLSLVMGLNMVDRVRLITFESIPLSKKRNILILAGLWFITVFGLFIFTDSFHTAITILVRAAQSGDPNIISFIASDLGKVDPEIYIQRYFVFFLYIRALFSFLFTTVLLTVYCRHVPSFLSALGQILFPAILMGICTSIRVLGPLAGLLIVYYMLQKNGRRALPTMVIYILIAIITVYLTWPYLWPNPIPRLFESIRVMSQYPWKGNVLFNGTYYASNNLPYSYIPVLLLIQFTEPVWPLFVIGLFALRRNSFALVSTLLWLVFPITALIFSSAPLYDNTRQIFFVLPPLFLVAGLGLESAFKRTEKMIYKIMIAGLILLPGLIACFRLHPYEYIYYNTLVKNPTGRFELDYWGTSYREAAYWLNENTPANKVVLAIGPAQIAGNYARIDLTILSESDSRQKEPDYVLILARRNWETDLYPEARVVHNIIHNGLLLSTIKEIQR